MKGRFHDEIWKRIKLTFLIFNCIKFQRNRLKNKHPWELKGINPSQFFGYNSIKSINFSPCGDLVIVCCSNIIDCQAAQSKNYNIVRKRKQLWIFCIQSKVQTYVAQEELILKGCLVQVGNGIELEAVGLQFEPYRWRPCGVTWDSSRTVVVIKLLRTSALRNSLMEYSL